MSTKIRVLEFELDPLNSAKRIDSFIAEYLQNLVEIDEEASANWDIYPSRAKVQQFITQGLVLLDEQIISKTSFLITKPTQIRLKLPEIERIELEADSSVRFDIIFEDKDIIVIDKPAQLVVHPGAGVKGKTLINGLLAYLGDSIRAVGMALRPGIVHRLDKGSSGLMVVAKNDFAFKNLVEQFLPPRRIKRRYLAITSALPKVSKGQAQDKGSIDAPIGRNPRNRKTMSVVSSGGREAKTDWRLIKIISDNLFLLELNLHTGRTHQIRVHLHYLGAGIIGDTTYPPQKHTLTPNVISKTKHLSRQALHAYSLSFEHPRTKKVVEFSSKLPEDIARIVKLGAFKGSS